jgi:hypothetical protein
MLARVSQLNPALFIMSSLLSMTYLRFRQTLTYSTMIGVASDDPAQSELNTKHFYSTLQVRETGSNIIMLLLRHTAHYHDAHDQINSDEGKKTASVFARGQIILQPTFNRSALPVSMSLLSDASLRLLEPLLAPCRWDLSRQRSLRNLHRWHRLCVGDSGVRAVSWLGDGRCIQRRQQWPPVRPLEQVRTALLLFCAR